VATGEIKQLDGLTPEQQGGLIASVAATCTWLGHWIRGRTNDNQFVNQLLESMQNMSQRLEHAEGHLRDCVDEKNDLSTTFLQLNERLAQMERTFIPRREIQHMIDEDRPHG
jgi:acyl carrier protein phosphodiesterase